MVILFNDGSDKLGANAAFAFGANGKDVDSVLHGFEAMGKKGGSGPQQFAVPAFNSGNDVVAGFIVQQGADRTVAAHEHATIVALAQPAQGGQQQNSTRLALNDESSNEA